VAFADGVRTRGPAARPLALRRVLYVLARVQSKLVEPDYPGAFRYLAGRNRKRALTVLFTDVIDPRSDALWRTSASLRPRHSRSRSPSEPRAGTPWRRSGPPSRTTRFASAGRGAAARRDEALGHMRRAACWSWTCGLSARPRRWWKYVDLTPGAALGEVGHLGVQPAVIN